MRYLGIFLLLTLIALPTFAEKIDWMHSYDSAIAKAHMENKPVMIDFYTSWCKWCKVLDQKTFPQSSVVEYSKNFVCAKVDAEAKVNEKVVMRYNINSFPRIVFFDDEGLILHQVNGFMEAPQFLKEMKASREKWEKLNTLKEKAEAGKDMEAIFEMANIYLESGVLDKADENYKLVIEDQKNEYVPDALLNLGVSYGQQQKYTEAAEKFAFFIEEYPTATRNDEAYYFLGITYFHLKDIEKAIHHLEQVHQKFPDSQLAEQAKVLAKQIESETK